MLPMTLYRLIIAGGRELAGNDAAPTYNDSSRVGITPVPISSTDTAAMRTYVQHYIYDAIGNMTKMKHTATGGTGSWTRNFVMDSASNRLASNSIGSNNPIATAALIYGSIQLISNVLTKKNVEELIFKPKS